MQNSKALRTASESAVEGGLACTQVFSWTCHPQAECAPLEPAARKSWPIEVSDV